MLTIAKLWVKRFGTNVKRVHTRTQASAQLSARVQGRALVLRHEHRARILAP